MIKKYNSVSELLSMPKGEFVKLTNGIKIFLFTVGMAIASPSYSSNDIEPADKIETQIGNGLEISLEANNLETEILYQTKQDLFASLQQHRIEMLSDDDVTDFWQAADEVSKIDFTDSMVCYEPEVRQLTYDILDKSGLVLHLTQYLDNPKGQVVYSIEKDARFLVAGHATVDELGVQLPRMLAKAVQLLG